MVRGLDLFLQHFKAFSDQYVLIGGAACDLAFDRAGTSFRVTKDLDIVLCVEALTRPFAAAFWSFVRAGGYRIQESVSGRKQFYRFRNPAVSGYPTMLELFSRTPDILDIVEGQHLAPIPVGEEILSLSAILLDDCYYAWILRGKTLLEGFPVVGPEYLIALKVKAWLDLTARKGAGFDVDSRDINKHRNDVFRLVAIMDVAPVPDVPDTIRDDLRKFLAAMNDETIDFKALGLNRRTMGDVVAFLRSIYGG